MSDFITNAELRIEAERLIDENDELRSEKSALCARIDELCQENEQLRQQNAKLDELLPENGRWFSFDVVRSLNDERDQLAAENAQLRERLKESDDGRMRQADNLIDKYHKIARLQTENSKLREFAGQVLYFTTMTDGCGDNCPYSSSDCRHECYLREQGHKLEIEVGKCMESSTM